MRHQLPTSNPECVHDWHASPTTHVWECTRCGYVVSETELHEPTEGQRTIDDAFTPDGALMRFLR